MDRGRLRENLADRWVNNTVAGDWQAFGGLRFPCRIAGSESRAMEDRVVGSQATHLCFWSGVCSTKG